MNSYCAARRRIRRNSGSGALAEFAPVLLVFFLLFLFPLINLVFYATAAATVMMMSRQTANICGSSVNYAAALTAMQSQLTNMTSSGFGQFAKITPNAGYLGCGGDLWIAETPVAGVTPKLYGPDTSLGFAPNVQNNIYEYQVKTNFTVAPFLNLSGIPFIGNVPIVGASSNLSYTISANAEHPEGLQ